MLDPRHPTSALRCGESYSFLAMWSIKGSFQSVFFGLVLKCFIVLACCSPGPKQTKDVELGGYFTAGKLGLQRLWRLTEPGPAYLPNVKNTDGKDMAKLSRTKKPQFNVLQKDFHFSAGM